jgi:hypothetical protein
MVGTARSAPLPPTIHTPNSSPSITRMLARSSRCAPNPPRASLTTDCGEASSNATVTASGTALIQSDRTGVSFFAAVGIRPAVRKQAQTFSGNIASRAARSTSEQNRNRLPGRGRGTLRDEHPERLCGIRHIGSLPRLAAFVSRFDDAIGVSLPSAGAAMQRYSWTNSRWTIFSPLPGAFSVPIESERGSRFFDLTRFLDANRSPLRWKTLQPGRK